jgi:hypothetical protein
MHENFQPLPIHGAWDDALLAPVAEINEQMLDCLRAMVLRDEQGNAEPGGFGAHGGVAVLAGAAPKLVNDLRSQWRQLDSRAQRRLSACPYLLLDGGFTQAGRWERIAGSGVMDAGLRERYFSGAAGIALVRRTLLLAWHLARSNRLMASVVLGMDAASAERIALTRLKDLEALAELAPAWIAPRWVQQPIIWRQLIAAARADDPLTLRQVQLRGLQLLAGPRVRPIC